jgi:hypothetical protein
MLFRLPVAVAMARRILLIFPTESWRTLGVLAERSIARSATTPEDTTQIALDATDSTVRSREGTAWTIAEYAITRRGVLRACSEY